MNKFFILDKGKSFETPKVQKRTYWDEILKKYAKKN